MKHILTILAAFTISVATLSAQNQTAPNTSVLTLFAKDGERFFVVLDGERKNAKAAARVTVPNLERSYYKVKIIFEDDKLGSIDDNLQVEGVDSRYNDITYQIRKKKKGDKMVYVINGYSFVPITAASGTQTPVVTKSDGNRGNDGENTTTETTTTETMPGGNVNMNVNVKGGENGMNTNVNMTTPEGESVNVGMNVNMAGMENEPVTNVNANTTVTTTKTTRTTTRGSGTQMAPVSKTTKSSHIDREDKPVQEPAKTTGCSLPMNTTSFAKQVDGLKKAAFEDTRNNMAKLMIKNNCLSTAQVRQVVKTMNFEESKLAFAKAAYARCTDKDNYIEVADEFNFSSSKDELMAEMSK